MTFAKTGRVFLNSSGKVFGEGTTKARHFSPDSSKITISPLKPLEIPFFDHKKDKIVRISTNKRTTVAVTEPKGKVYFVGDKFAKMIEFDNSAKFGF